MLRTHFKSSQFIVVSLKDGMFNNANVLFKTKFVDGVSTVTRWGVMMCGGGVKAEEWVELGSGLFLQVCQPSGTGEESPNCPGQREGKQRKEWVSSFSGWLHMKAVQLLIWSLYLIHVCSLLVNYRATLCPPQSHQATSRGEWGLVQQPRPLLAELYYYCHTFFKTHNKICNVYVYNLLEKGHAAQVDKETVLW